MDKKLEDKLNMMSEKQIIIEEKINEQNVRLLKIEDSNKWLFRTIFGALILGALAILYGI